MTSTTNLGLPFIDAAQAQKHVTHNEALRILDAVTHIAVIARDLVAPPPSPAEGDRYLVPPGATSAFAGYANWLAAWEDGAWRFAQPRAGWRLYVANENRELLFDGSVWADIAGAQPSSFHAVALGVGAPPDATTPLIAKLNSALLTARSLTDGGSGDLRLALNKSATANVGSQIFETNYSARAEIGLIGDDNFRISVSPDGQTFKTALRVDASVASVAVDGPLSCSAAAIDLGSSSAAATYAFGAGATLAGNVKAVALGTGGLPGSTTNVELGPNANGAVGAIIVNTPLRLRPQAIAPAAPSDGDLWYDAGDKMFRARGNGRTTAFVEDELPWMMADVGRYIRTATGCCAATTTLAGVANAMDIYPFIPRIDVNVDRLSVNVVTAVASAAATLVLYASNADGRPDALILETGGLSLATAGVKEATVALSLKKGRQYWIGVRHSAAATLSAWQLYNSPDLDLAAVAVNPTKILRRSLAFATPAPANWPYLAADGLSNTPAVAIWLRVA